MIQVTPHMRIWVANAPIDFRNGIDGTGALIQRILNKNPIEGHLFVFINRRRTMIRLLVYDGQGFWLMTKRLSKGTFRYWSPKDGHPCAPIDPHQLQVLITAGDFTKVPKARIWRPVG